MKTLKTAALAALLTSCMFHASAQKTAIPLNEPNHNKQKIFADLPEKMALRIKDAESLLDLPVGASVNATLAAGFPVVGTVVSKSNPADTSVRSVVIRTSRQNSTFTFSRIKTVNGGYNYIGRMLNLSGGDALEIAREGQGYILRKKGIYDLVNE